MGILAHDSSFVLGGMARSAAWPWSFGATLCGRLIRLCVGAYGIRPLRCVWNNRPLVIPLEKCHPRAGGEQNPVLFLSDPTGRQNA